jgi:IclR family acetate operon transcriptional repressor
VDLGYVIRDDASKSYLPSARALFPLGLYHPIQELRRDAADLLMEVQRTTTVTSALQIFLGGQRVVIDQRHGSSRLTPFWNTTVTSALHSSSSGKLYLSTLGADERRKLVGPGPFERFTPTTLTTFAALEANLKQGVERGYFSAREEAFAGMSSAAAPLRVPNGGIIGAMIATGTSGQLQGDKLEECGLVVKRAADMLSTMSPAVRALEPLLGH